MAERIGIIFLNILILFTILIVQWIIPNISRKNILLGVKIPEDQITNPRVKEIIKGYRIETSIAGGLLLVISTIWTYRVPDGKLFTMIILGYLFLLFLVYLRWNKRVKALKTEMNWDKLAANTIAVDTAFSRGKGHEKILSGKWFLIPFGMVLINFIFVLYRYPSIPDQIPIHWDLYGNADAWMNKSIFTSLYIPLTQLLLTLIIYGSYYFMMKSKKRVDPKNPEISIRKNIKYRRIWGIYFVLCAILLVLQFTYNNFMTLGIIGNIRFFNYATLFIAAAIVISAIVIGVKVGQGGERLKLAEEKLEGEYDVEDDKYWKLGNTFYYNKEDPAWFVEKRVGIGWTVNVGRWFGKAVIIAAILIILSIFI